MINYEPKRGLTLLITILAFCGLAFTSGDVLAQQDEWQPVSADEAFQHGYIQVIGTSEAGQSKYRAMRAAKVIAQMTLLEEFKGVRVQGDITVQDGMLESETIRTEVKGFLRGAKVCGQKYHSEDRSGEVCLRLYLKGNNGVYASLYPKLQEEKVGSISQANSYTPPSTQQTPQSNHDGIIIEMSGLIFKPAIVNRILNDKGDILFDPAKVVNAILVERGTGGFTSQLDKAKGLLASWGSKNPLIVKALETRKGTDVVVNAEDASTLFAADQKNSFLSQAKVVFVIN